MKKYTLEERLAIGREIYEKRLNREEAAVKYGVSPYTARDYLRLYKAAIVKYGCGRVSAIIRRRKVG